jgi:hypothetical protein
MAWFKVDDGFNNHRKVKELRRGAERLRAIGLWTLAGSYSSDEGLGGLVPESIVEEWGATKKDVEALIRVGLWKRVDDAAAEFHDWDHYQPDAATLKAQRDKESVSGQLGNHRRWHVRRGVAVADCEFCYRVPDQEPDWGPESGPESGANRVSVGSSSPVPVPDPDISSNEEMSRPRPDVERLCAHLADRIEANGSKRPGITKRWHDSARLMLDSDGRTEDEIRRAIDWCQAHEFWRGNVMSMPKLREKYDQMRLQAARTATAPTRKNDIDWEAAAARAAAREATEPDWKELA